MCRGSLFFASIASKKARPKAATKLFNSPLPNLYSYGYYCTGNAGSKIPKDASVNNIPVWEAFLFDTTNTNLGSCQPLKNATSTAELIDLIESEGGGFPTKELVPMGLTLNEWINEIDAKSMRRG
jgi:PRTRC genetic system protein B